jgi:hypothetical protein
MGEFYGIGSCSDGVCECCPGDGVWVFLIALIFSQVIVPHLMLLAREVFDVITVVSSLLFTLQLLGSKA